MTSITFNTFAKVNLRLKVTGKRDDGYHLLSMCNAQISLCDTITIEVVESPGIEITVSGNESEGVPDDDRNLVWRAADILLKKSESQSGVRIALQKEIPNGGGLGGGSSNGAGILRELPKLLGLDISDDELRAIALELGADLPYLLDRRFAEVRGVGEVIAPISWELGERDPILLFTGLPSLSTERVFKERNEEFSEDTPAPKNYSDLVSGLSNDLEFAARRLSPELGEALDLLRGELGDSVQMSGSGSTLYYLPKTRHSIEESHSQKATELATKLGMRVVPCHFLSAHYYGP